MPKKGSSPAGTTTSVQSNPTQTAQLPFLTGGAGQNTPSGNTNVGWNQAYNLATGNPFQYYPGTTLNIDPSLAAGYRGLIDTGYGNASAIAGTGNNTFNTAATGGFGIGNSPAYPGYSALSRGATDPQLTLGADSGALRGVAETTASSPYAGYLLSLNNGIGAGGQTYANDLAQAGGRGNPYAGYLEQLDNGMGMGGLTYASGLARAGASAASNPYALDLGGLAKADSPVLGSAYDTLAHAGAAAGSGNAATDMLAREASGAFLGSNPYLDRQFSAAADPVVRAYQTATAPQTDSNYEAAGRYGSGALANARSQNQLDLGTTLDKLSASIYGNDYANERGLMTGAQGTLGSLTNQGIGLQESAGSAIGNLGLGEIGQRQSAFGTAGSLFGQGQGQNISALTGGGNLTLNDAATRAGILNSAGSLTGQAQGQNINALSNAGNLTLSDISTRGGLLNSAGNQYLGGLGQAGTAYGQSGGLASALSGSMATGLAGLQGGYQAGNSAALQGLALQPQVQAANATPSQNIIAGGTGLTGLNQQTIQDLMARFYGNQQAPWTTNQNYLNQIGQPTTGSASTTSPYFTNPLASTLGAGIGGLSLANNSGLFSGLGGAAASVGGDYGGGGAALGIADSVANSTAGAGGGGFLSWLFPALAA